MSETKRFNSFDREWLHFAYAVGVFAAISLLVQLAGIKFAAPTGGASSIVAQAQVVSNPQDPMNAVNYTVYIALAGVAVLALRKLPVSGLLDYLILLFVWDLSAVLAMSVFGFAPLVAAALGGVFVFVYHSYHPWWLVNLLAVAFGAYGAAVLGRNFGLLPAVLLLIATAVYDYVAVLRTGHMVSIAKTLTRTDIPMPAVLVVPTSWRFLDGERHVFDDDHAITVGLGDFVVPAVLAVSAAVWVGGAGVEVLGVAVPWPALGAILGVLVGNVAVLYALLRANRPLPGLPFVNTGAVVGFLVGALPVVV